MGNSLSTCDDLKLEINRLFVELVDNTSKISLPLSIIYDYNASFKQPCLKNINNLQKMFNSGKLETINEFIQVIIKQLNQMLDNSVTKSHAEKSIKLITTISDLIGRYRVMQEDNIFKMENQELRQEVQRLRQESEIRIQAIIPPPSAPPQKIDYFI